MRAKREIRKRATPVFLFSRSLGRLARRY